MKEPALVVDGEPDAGGERALAAFDAAFKELHRAKEQRGEPVSRADVFGLLGVAPTKEVDPNSTLGKTLAKYDANGDGIFSDGEVTNIVADMAKEKQKAKGWCLTSILLFIIACAMIGAVCKPKHQ
jgi:hypothetical protein